VGVIHRLPEDVSGKIAAGEVIEGPFSVVRELIDNSLDAGAGEVSVNIQGGGKDLIQVSDDGCGMSEEDAVLAAQKHTTSKIRSLEDLDFIATMGFRGEALSSISAVCEFTMRTRREEDERGTMVTVRFGGDIAFEPAAANRGTDITVKNLFHNLPARRKFLKADRAESARVKEEVLKKALSFHKTGFAFRSDDRRVFRLLPRSSALERTGEIYGPGLEKNLTPFAHRGERFTISGCVSNRLHTLSNRNGQFVFVNGRPVEDRGLLFALNGPARGIVPAGRYVYAFVFIEIDPGLLDINVHPAKKEIRIKIEREITGALALAVRKALEERFYPLGWVDSSGMGLDMPRRAPGSPGMELDTAHGAPGTPFPPAECGSDVFRRVRDPGGGEVREEGVLHAGAGGEEAGGEGAVGTDTGSRDFRSFSTQPLLFQGSLPGSEELSFRGTLFGTFSLFEGRQALLMLDQHAAHERVLYERFMELERENRVMKSLLVPINATPPRAWYGEILDSLDVLRDAGFEVEPFGDDSVNVNTVPGFIPDDFEEEAVSLMIEGFGSGRPAAGGAEIRERFMKLAACRGAVKEGDPIGREEAFRLLDDLRKTKVPFVCPHGRPTCYLMSRDSIEKAFRRR
jgi:DNA mismatch repair protein MutL